MSEMILYGSKHCSKYKLLLSTAAILWASPAFAWPAFTSFQADTAAEATAIGSTYVGREVFQLQGSTSSSLLYSDPFPITTWGESRPTPGAWENQSGIMQTIMQRDFPADWFDLEPRYDGLYILHQWHEIEGSQGSASNYAHSYPWYITGLDYLKGIKIQRGDFFMYRWINDTPATYQIFYSSHASNVPEPHAILSIAIALCILVCMDRLVWRCIIEPIRHKRLKHQQPSVVDSVGKIQSP